jgi:hypothetical protein
LGLRIDYYPTRLTEEDLRGLSMLVLQNFDHAPVFSAWLVGLLQDEQLRRLKGGPVTVPELPLDWRGADLAAAQRMATVLSYAELPYGPGRFVDSLVHSLNAIVAVKLEAVR